jgi:signal transduction histidine kinase
VDDIRRNDSNLQFSRLLALIQVAAVTLIVLVIGVTAVWISRAHDELSETGTKRMISGGISALEDKLQTIAVDYSVWALAYNAIRGHDIAWIYENVGTGAASEAAVFDLIMIIEPGEVARYGWVRGTGKEPSADLLPGDTVTTMLRLLNNEPVDSMQAKSRFVRIDGQTWLLSITRVIPFEDSLPQGMIDEDLPRQLFGLKIDDALMAELGGNFLVDDLSTSAEPAPGMSSLAFGDGSGGGFAVWAPSRPGNVILGRMALPLILVLGSIALASALVSRYMVRSAKRLERAVDAAQIADRAKTEFLANVSHELRTPMNGVIGIGQLMQTMKLEPKLNEMVGVLLTSARSQMTIIEELLDIARIDSGQRLFELAPFDPLVALNEVRDLLALKADGKGISLDIEAPANFNAHVLGDSGCYKQILTNLIDNAIKFTDQGGVTVRLESKISLDEMCVLVTVADTGTGIDPKHHKLIFERFGQVDGSLTRGAGGTGLGLAITKSIVELMGGKLTLKSELGKGAVFSLEVALEVVTNPSAKIAAE